MAEVSAQPAMPSVPEMVSIGSGDTDVVVQKKQD